VERRDGYLLTNHGNQSSKGSSRTILVNLTVPGYITFSSYQELVLVPEVRVKLLDAWGIDVGVRVGEFSTQQNAYLDYHRANVFKRSLLER
jgi:hypothetical protein